MHAVEQSVLRFLKEDASGRSKAVVNLGCGYDPLPWQFLRRHAVHCTDTMFIDVDYPQLVQKKVKIIQKNDLLSQYLPGITSMTGSETVLARSGSLYAAVGCDLRDMSTLETVLREQLGLGNGPVLFVAEVSITYMNVEGADSLIQWASSFSNGKPFCTSHFQ
jgi:tRNA wybutosine-synthesizing protein 4